MCKKEKYEKHRNVLVFFFASAMLVILNSQKLSLRTSSRNLSFFVRTHIASQLCSSQVHRIDKKKSRPTGLLFLLVEGAIKKIFLPFSRMTSNSCKNEILADARMKSANADEIFGFSSDEIKSTHSPSRRISSNEVGFHRRRRFRLPVRVDLVEKPTS